MSKTLITLLFACFSYSGYSQTGKPAFEGAWQLCFPYEEEGVMKMRMLPHIKVFGPSTFAVYDFKDANKPVIISDVGEYKVLSDSTYVVTINQKDSITKYVFNGNDFYIDKGVTTEGKKKWSVWKRLGMKLER